MERESFEIEDTQTLLKSFVLRGIFPLHKSPEWFSGHGAEHCATILEACGHFCGPRGDLGVPLGSALGPCGPLLGHLLDSCACLGGLLGHLFGLSVNQNANRS